MLTDSSGGQGGRQQCEDCMVLYSVIRYIVQVYCVVRCQIWRGEAGLRVGPGGCLECMWVQVRAPGMEQRRRDVEYEARCCNVTGWPSVREQCSEMKISTVRYLCVCVRS